MARKPGSPKFATVTALMWHSLRELSDDAALAYLYLWTGPRRNMTGISADGAETLAFERRWTQERAQTALDELRNADLIETDPAARVVAVTGALDIDPPSSGSVVQGWAGVLADFPQSPVIEAQLDRLQDYCQQRGDNWRQGYAALMEALPLRFKGRVSGGVSGRVIPSSEHQTPTPTPPPTPKQQQSPARARDAAPGVSAAAREEEIAKLTAQGMTRAEAVAQVDASPAAADATQHERVSA